MNAYVWAVIVLKSSVAAFSSGPGGDRWSILINGQYWRMVNIDE